MATASCPVSCSSLLSSWSRLAASKGVALDADAVNGGGGGGADLLVALARGRTTVFLVLERLEDQDCCEARSVGTFKSSIMTTTKPSGVLLVYPGV